MGESDGDDDDSFDQRVASNPHDALFRRTFGNPVHAEGELRSILPPELVEMLDLSSLKTLPGSFVDAKLRERESDLLYSVRLHERDALVYVLFEHQSTADARMPLRLLGYMVRIWEQHAARNPSVQSRLPPIIPVVLHHDRGQWPFPTRFMELF